jgi:hypothetical protein
VPRGEHCCCHCSYCNRSGDTYPQVGINSFGWMVFSLHNRFFRQNWKIWKIQKRIPFKICITLGQMSQDILHIGPNIQVWGL